jgi:hypothetical protein
MQAAIIQQDSIAEIHEVLVGKPLDASGAGFLSWLKVRELRNICAGHPAKKDRPKTVPLTRTFMGRAFGGYDVIHYEQWQEGSGTTQPTAPLGALLDAYAVEAAAQLANILAAMQSRWP